MKKYKVIDNYDGLKEEVGYADTIAEVKKLAKWWCEEVTDEARLYYIPVDEETGEYKFSKRIFLETY